MTTFQGYLRRDGQAGIRNNVICMAAANCVNSFVNQIVQRAPGVIPLRHTDGCGDAQKSPYYEKLLVNLANNPNHYAVILVGLGCGGCRTESIADEISKLGKPFYYANLKESGSRQALVESAVKAAEGFLRDAALEKKQELPLSKIIMGTECGGSDALSGITANPSIGYVSDWLISEGGTSILTETAELIGCEKILADRAVNPELAAEVYARITNMRDMVTEISGLDSASVSPGNMKGGLTTIQEKSLGCVNKGGDSPVAGLFDYGELIGGQTGLLIMDGTNHDAESQTGMVASGAQVIMFSSGRGSPLGFPSCPVIKICSNPQSYQQMGGDIDINAGQIVTDGISLQEFGDRCIQFFLEVLNGRLTVTEANKYWGPMGIAKRLFPRG